MIAAVGPVVRGVGALSAVDDTTSAVNRLVQSGPGHQGVTFNRVARSAAGATDDVAIATGAFSPDLDDAQKARQRINGPDADDVARAKKPAAAPFTPYESGTTQALNTVGRVVAPAESLLQFAGMVPLVTDVGLLAAGWGAGKLGYDKVREKLRAPHEYMYAHDLKGQKLLEGNPHGKLSIGNVLNDATFVAANALGIFSVAHSFSQKLDALKQMRADITGKDVKTISTFSLLTASDLTPAEKDVRAHLLKEHLLRGAIQIGGLAFNIKSLRSKGSIPIAGFMVPQVASMGVDMAMGESCASYYKALSDSHKGGEKIPADAYAEFLLTTSKEIRSHGRVGAQMAHAIGADLAKENTPPGDVLKMLGNGQLHTRIEQKLHERAHPKQAAEPSSMVDRLHGKATPDRPVVGKFTQDYKAREMAAASQRNQLGA